jgi:putative SOS response-associated peptidase YedK
VKKRESLLKFADANVAKITCDPYAAVALSGILTAIDRLYKPRFNIAPEQISPNIPVIVRHKGGNGLMHWGLIPSWADDPTIGNRMINARAGSLTEKPAFKHLVGSRRCIIPADGFYE